ncbi:hypothetical protein SteCoe_12444 [Stentor coeruleus]|uniref:Uncharacterized protein n=1 Tax=Stentor coeruleus TaxID=5963 RepID=A0A1R2CAQ6_9CILI|nr:hypothetical protein SteCoe_12444 [Stentor coeruleus]
MTEDLPKSFPEEILIEIIKSQTPLKLVTPIVHENFKYLGPLITEEDSKVTTIICNFLIDSLVYFNLTYNFSLEQCSVVLDIILWLILHSSKTSNFVKEMDLEYLKTILLPYIQGMNPLLPSKTLTDFLNHLNITYFGHYTLYKFLFTEMRSQENIVELLDIDTPLPKSSHNTAIQRVYKPIVDTQPVIETIKETEVVVVKESLRERLLKNMDESVKDKFLDKIAEARESMAKQLEQRDKMLKQKWEELEKELKRKRRRG